MGLFKKMPAQTPELHNDDTTPVERIAVREVVRVRGQIIAMRARPAETLPSLVVTIRDESGRVTVVWTGRRSITGIGMGRYIIIEGVATETTDGLTFTNPAYQLLG